jgi:serine-type D-Ala-D-Ala carboxypeptidase (penicillin-binding protein 5/6)
VDPSTTRQQRVYRRRRIVVGSGLAVLLAAGFYLPLTLLAPIDAAPAQVLAVPAPTPSTPQLSFPPYGAAAVGAVGYDGVLATGGSTEALPIASITKIVTALVSLDARPLALGEPGPGIELSDIDEQFYAEQVADGGSVAPVEVGVTISQYAMLQLMLLPSANNYAESMASWAFGSEDAFLAAARVWLDSHGLAATTITDPTGILPSNVSTATDLVALAKLAIENPVIAEIVATPSADIPGIAVVENTNSLLGRDGVDGIKTGTLDEAGSCLLFSADYVVGGETVTLVGAALGGPNRPTLNENITTLLAGTLAGFQQVTLVTAGQPIAEYDTIWGDASTAVAAEDVSIVTWIGTPISVLVESRSVLYGAPGDDVGELSFAVGPRTVTVPIELDTTIDDPGPWWRLSNPFALF